MVEKLMYISIDDLQSYPFVDYNKWLIRLDSQLYELSVPKFVKPINQKSSL